MYENSLCYKYYVDEHETRLNMLLDSIVRLSMSPSNDHDVILVEKVKRLVDEFACILPYKRLVQKYLIEEKLHETIKFVNITMTDGPEKIVKSDVKTNVDELYDLFTIVQGDER